MRRNVYRRGEFEMAEIRPGMMGAVLDKYEALGGPAASDLGFPITSEVRGLAGPDSRVSTFSASDRPLIYWTADHGAFVVRGAINAAWDKLGSSGGALGVRRKRRPAAYRAEPEIPRCRRWAS